MLLQNFTQILKTDGHTFVWIFGHIMFNKKVFHSGD
jgi:hypothetical protein